MNNVRCGMQVTRFMLFREITKSKSLILVVEVPVQYRSLAIETILLMNKTVTEVVKFPAAMQFVFQKSYSGQKPNFFCVDSFTATF